MADHNKFLTEIEEEVQDIRAKQRKVQEEMIVAEQGSLAKWREDKEKNKVDEGTVDALLAGRISKPKNRRKCSSLTDCIGYRSGNILN